MLDKVRNIMDINSPFFQFGRKLVYVFAMNIIFIVTSIPIITAGASMTAMNSVFLKIINERDFSLLRDYFRAFKENFIKSTVVWVAALAVCFIIYIDIFYWVNYGIADNAAYAYVMLALTAIAALFLIMLLHTVFPIISRFDMSYKELMVNTFLITIKDILYVIEAVIFTAAIVGSCAYMLIAGGGMLRMIYMVFLCFGLNGLAQSYIYRKVLNKYSEDYVEMVKRVDKELREEGFYDED